VPHLLVISNVVPKIWARTNSAMVEDARGDAAYGAGGSVCGGVVVKRDCGSTGVCDLKDDAWDWLGGQDRSRARTAATRTEKTREKKICRDCSGLFLSVGAWPW